MNEENNFQVWMDSEGYTDVRFYPKNTNAYGMTDMINCASKAVELYESGEFTIYEDNIESFIETI